MAKQVLIFVILFPLLFNGVRATTHVTEGDHDSHNIPHLHFDIENHQTAKSKLSKSEISGSKSSNSELSSTRLPDTEVGDHERHEHFHIYLNAFIKTDELRHFGQHRTDNLFRFNSQFKSLIPSPPTPPPNI